MSEKTALEKQVGGNHYKKLAIQPIEYCQRNNLNYCESSAIKYITRHRDKNGRQDIEKAIHCLELLLQMEYPEIASPSFGKSGMMQQMQEIIKEHKLPA